MRPSLKFPTLAAMVLALLLVGCRTADVPPPSLTTAVALPTAASTAQPAATEGPERTSTPIPVAPTSIPALEDALLELALLEPENLDQMAYLGIQELDPELAPLEFTGWDWSQDGQRIVTCSWDGTASHYRVYDLFARTRLTEITFPEGDLCGDGFWENPWLQFSRDGNLFLGLTRPGAFMHSDRFSAPVLFDSRTGEQLAALEELPEQFPGEIGVMKEAAFSSQGTRLAISVYYPAVPASTEDANVEGGTWFEYRTGVQLYDVQTGAHWGTFQKLEHWELLDLEYSTEGDYLTAATFEAVEAWNVAKGGIAHQVYCPAAEITLSPTAEIAALTCIPRIDEPYQLLWDPVSGEENLLTGAPGNDFRELTFSPDGRMLIGLSESGQVSIWHGVSGDHLYTLPDTFKEAVDVHFTHGGRAVAVLDADGRLKLYGVQ